MELMAAVLVGGLLAGGLGGARSQPVVLVVGGGGAFGVPTSPQPVAMPSSPLTVRYERQGQQLVRAVSGRGRVRYDVQRGQDWEVYAIWTPTEGVWFVAPSLDRKEMASRVAGPGRAFTTLQRVGQSPVSHHSPGLNP